MTAAPADLDRPDVIEAVAAAFGCYERALMAGDVDALTAFFWDSPDVVRFGVVDEEWGSRELLEWRRAHPGVPEGRTLSRTRINTFGAETAVVSTLFTYPEGTYPDGPRLGRQSQVWRLIAGSWVIVHAHVSEYAP